MTKTKSVIIPCILGFLFFTALGVCAIIYPNILMDTLSLTVGAVILILGLWQIWQGLSKKSEIQAPFLKVFLGIIICALGIIFIIHTNTPYLLFCISFGIWAIMSGAFKVAASLELKRAGEKIGFLLTVGIIHLIFGVAMIVFPIVSSELWFRVIGIYWVYMGICFFVTMFTKEKSYLV